MTLAQEDWIPAERRRRGEPSRVAAASHREEIAAFCDREYPRLVGALSLYCGDGGLAEELAQEALVTAIDKWSRVRRARSPGAYVHRIGMNVAHRWFRRRAAEQRAVVRAAGGTAGEGDADVAGQVAVREAVAGLPHRQRRCVVLRFYLGYSVAEVAEMLGTTRGSVAALTYRALSGLRGHLGDDGLPAAEEVDDV